ncbi:MAG TPA: nitrite/sulfite reductase, partial [Candidatus Binatus sp.]|nr:nitrite/sulfite reductase [Candidatus Binatus sp.]
MYRYDEFDAAFVSARVDQFRGQVARRVSGELTEEQFRPHRLMNGLYLQLHAYMLRVAIPYGTLNSQQLRKLAEIARKYDRGYGHFTTRQNLQYNWPALKDTPDILAELASVEMHAIQTSGNCIRNVTADHFAGVAADEIADPRPYAEILRQWSSQHPEFSFLPRKFKIAVNGGPHDRAAIQAHDIGLQIVRDASGALGFTVYVGGGLGRTPFVGKRVREFLPERDLLSYCDAILRVYNLEGRRDNKYKARIKILLHEKGLEGLRAAVEAEFAASDHTGLELPDAEIARIKAYFAAPPLPAREPVSARVQRRRGKDAKFADFVQSNVAPHKVTGYVVVTASLKPIGGVPGDASADQMDAVADLAEDYSSDELRVSHEQNLILPHVALDDLPAVY